MSQSIRFVVTFAVGAFVAVAAQAKQQDSVIYYRSPFETAATSGIVYDLAGKKTGNHIFWSFKTCDVASQFDCLYVDEVDFALGAPKRDMPVGTTFRIGKFQFVIREAGSIRFAGRRLNATVIDTIVDGAPEGKAHIRAVYDPKFGLVCYGYLNWLHPTATGNKRVYDTIDETECAEDIGLWPREK
ncbi:MAG: hypothetical protein HOP13_18015 [Alphaproteobacteria bacterium]|nr:hypothetical protein [Alphaproteobacteria bacterium]